MKEKKNKHSIVGRFRSSVFLSLLIIGMVVGIVMVVNMNPTEIILHEVRQKEWRGFTTGDGPLDPDESGFLAFYAYPHQANPSSAYATNLSNATAYEYSDVLDAEMSGETPYNTPFDFVCKLRVNDTVGYNTSGSCWEPDWVRVFITVDFQFASDVGNTTMTIVEITHTNDFCWYHGYINNQGAGYQITKNEKYNVTELCGQGYW